MKNPISIIGSMFKGNAKPDTNEVIVSPNIDRWSTYPSINLTPVKLAEILREADTGDVYQQMLLFEEMLEKDLHLFGLFQMRKLAVKKLGHQILPGSDDAKHIEHAKFSEELIDNIKDWSTATDDMLDATPKGFSVQQIYWNTTKPIIGIDKLVWTHQKHFRFGKGSDPKSDFYEIRRITDTNRWDGVELEKNRWLISIIQAASGHPARKSLLRICTWMYLFKNFDVKAWIQFAEVYGSPLRVGKYDQGTSTEDKKVLRDALRGLSTDAYALIPKTTDIEFKEAIQKAATAAIHDDLANFCNMEMSKGVLGHTGVADSTPGKLGNDNTAQEVRWDINYADCQALDNIVTQGIIIPAVTFQFGPQDRYPKYKTPIIEPKDMVQTVNVLDGAINRIRIPVGKKYIYNTLNIPMPEKDEEVIAPPDVPIQSPGQPMPAESPLHKLIFGGLQ
jgi:phage gp29-like protein